MREIDFKETFGKILRRWPKSFSEDQIDMVYNSVKDLSFSDFGKIVDRVLTTMKAAPTISEIGEIRRGMGFISKVPLILEQKIGLAKKNGRTYKIREGLSADERYVYVNRSGNYSFIIKSDNPDHLLVLEDKKFREENNYSGEEVFSSPVNNMVFSL